MRAARSALEQEPPPLEVLVCDDGSTDGTQAAFEDWEAREPRLRYVRVEPNRGTPGPVRNIGAAKARGDWVALLDDDDRWLPGKLAAQAPFMAGEAYDVVAGDALRSNGTPYFGFGGGSRFPNRAEVERDNPIIISSSVVRRSALLGVGGFDETPALAGLADYDLWLRLADAGARFAIVDQPVIEYEDAGLGRMSMQVLPMQRQRLRVRLRRWIRSPRERQLLVSFLREIYFTLALTVRLASLRVRRGASVG